MNKTIPTEEEILKVLQHLADVKIASYEAKWSKNSDDNIATLKDRYTDVKKLTKYFTKR